MNKPTHSAFADTAEEAIAAQDALDNGMITSEQATEVFGLFDVVINLLHALGFEAHLSKAKQFQYNSPGPYLGHGIHGAVGGDQCVLVMDVGLHDECGVAHDHTIAFGDEGGKFSGSIQFAVASPVDVQTIEILLADFLVLAFGQCLKFFRSHADGDTRIRVERSSALHRDPHLISRLMLVTN